MTLATYKQRRTFDETPEPQGGFSDGKQLRFVVQKHAASHLHYDFRLEMGGALVSWAVPKGPSLNPSVKHLAMAVEDHPIDYRNFEGIIPKGNYGGGTVMIWDEGYYTPLGADKENDTKDNQDKELRHQLHAGKITFKLYGEKLKGNFALVKAKARGDNAWLLMKLKDKYASVKDILEKDKSIVSKKSMDEISLSPDEVYQTKASAQKNISAVVKTKKKISNKPSKATSKKKSAKISDIFSPMLATLVDKPPTSDEWSYEIKWDGYRAVALLNGEQAELKSRNDKSFNEKFYPIYNELLKLKLNAVLDGEIVVINDKGISNFGALQNWRSEADGTLIYYLFDIMSLNGKDLSSKPFSERREILEKNMPASSNIRLSETFDASGAEFFSLAQKMNLEGIIAKKKNSLYEAGARTSEWLKIKTNKRQEVVIGGFTKNENSDKLFSALLVGVYHQKKLIYTGKIGTGFTEARQKEMMSLFKPLIIKKPPFDSTPDINKPSRFRPNPPHAVATWLKPSLICEVTFTEMTSDGVMRHPSFEGMRSDKKASSVILEKEKSIQMFETAPVLSKKKMIMPAKTGRASLLNPKDETQVKEIDGHSIKFTNLSKVYWPDDGVTKRDMLNYYYQVAPYILPYLQGRPQSLNRFPNGINGKSFYQKDVTGKVPEWIETYLYHSSDTPEDKNFMVASDEASVLYMASLGCIELNPWSSRTESPDNPDWCIIDLDPGKNSFDQVIEAAKVTKEILDEMKIPSYPKTSGSTGLHIYIPLGAKYTYEQSKEFARVIVTLVHRRIPKYTSIERMVANRGGKMYLDFLQNRPKATLASAYSLRPKPGATVSMPLDWEEVKKGLTMKHFTIFNSVERIKSNGDIFKSVLGKGINLEKIFKELNS